MTSLSTNSTVLDEIKSMNQNGEKSRDEENYEQALSYFIEAVTKIQWISKSSDNDYQQLECSIYLNITYCYLHQHELVKADKWNRKAEELAKQLQDEVKISTCLNNQGLIKRIQGDYSGALIDINKALKMRLKCFGNEHSIISKSYRAIGDVYNDQRKHDEALSMFNKSLKMQLVIFGDDHLNIAQTYDSIARTYNLQSKHDEALSMLNKSLKIQLVHLGDNHPSLALTYRNFGDTYSHQGKYNNALSMYYASLKIKIEQLGENHPDVANRYNSIGVVYLHQGKHNDALSMYKKSLKIKLMQGDDNHPEIANTYCNIGSVYYQQGKFDDALLMFDKSLQIAVAHPNGNHSNAAIYSNIASIYYKQGKHNDALLMFNKSLKIKLAQLGDDHPDIAISCSNIASVYAKQSKYDDALSMLNKSLKIQLSQLGGNHPRIAFTYKRIGDIYSGQGKYNDALSMLNKSLKIQLAQHDSNRPDLANTYGSIGTVYQYQGKYNDALLMYNKTLKIELARLGDNHPSIASTYANIATAYYRQGKSEDALLLYNKSLKIQLTQSNDNHPNIAVTYNNIAAIYESQHKHTDALSMLKKSLKIYLTKFGNNHPTTALIYINIGSLYIEQSKYDDARFMYSKSLQVLLATLGENHLHTAKCYEKLAQVDHRQSNYHQAISLYRKSIDSLHNVYEENHPQILHVAKQIAECNNQLHENEKGTVTSETAKVIHQPLQEHVVNQTVVHDSTTSPDKENSQESQTGIKDNTQRHNLKYQGQHSRQSNNQVEFEQNDKKAGDNSTNVDINKEKEAIEIFNDGSLKIENTDLKSENSTYTEAINDKEYIKAYNEALQDGQCRNDFTKIIFAGPESVGKTTIMNVFTNQGIIISVSQTEIIDDTGRYVNLIVYNILDKKIYHFQIVLYRKVLAAIQKFKTKLNIVPNINPDIQVSKVDRQIQTIETDTFISTDKIKSVISDNRPMAIDTLVSTVSITQKIHKILMYEDFMRSIIDMKGEIVDDDNQYGKLVDFGGQAVYHVTHRPFLSGNSIYILVFNITRDFDDFVIDREGNPTNMTYRYAMQEWLTSIIGSHDGDETVQVEIDGKLQQYSLPVVILVASHGDRIQDCQERQRRFKTFENSIIATMPIYKSNICFSDIIFHCDPDDKSSAAIEQRRQTTLQLHELIKRIVSSLPFMKKSIPIRWYIMASILHTSVNDISRQAASTTQFNRIINRIHNIMTLEEVKQLAIDCELYENDEKLRSMLLYLHDIGDIVYCRKKGVEEMIVTNLDWLLNIFRSIIKLDKREYKSANVRESYNQAYQTGKISEAYIDNIVVDFELKKKEKDFVLQLMDSYNIICKIEDQHDSLDNKECHQQYFIPYLLNSSVGTLDLTDYRVSDWLYIGYDEKVIPYIPDGIFYCLLSACLKVWNNSRVKVYYRCAKYYIPDYQCQIVVKKEESRISLLYCYQKYPKEIASRIENNIGSWISKIQPHIIIRDKLNETINERMPKFKSAQSRFYVRCNECSKMTEIVDSYFADSVDIIRCVLCEKFFKSKPTRDWMLLRKERLTNTYADKVTKLSYNYFAERPDINRFGKRKGSCKSELTHDRNADKKKRMASRKDSKYHFFQIANRIGLDWTRLAARLDRSIDVDVIKEQDNRIFDRAMKFLDTWYDRNFPNVNVDQLKAALERIGRNDIVLAISST
ncbi:uncharacterized protein TRIADDRAFT_61714 [Trichoplax adhaerens]|uniref:Death domain-containing protein n=1 Tax=Trichoplax adhaerens TaxID=10228 RepID=B3SBS0_TRIAD|nr:hypothetical protein TRIADDRAFT_61714 [Trichoplax adhaerens]EDV19843.1 hypothetical protein TRIADDRAFT_61714 [Trichoplax adhaerens]|eukprot:XP_002117713.1 hypothetical protein TRIADDRAFT_61714 [Trichoplax adhaerens]